MTIESDSINILFLGTGAADWPVPYHPASSGMHHGTVRGYSSVLIEGQVLIDCGTTVPDAIHHFGVDANNISDILLTHTHTDHFDINAVNRLLLSRKHGKKPVNLWAHPSSLARLPEIAGVCMCAAEVGETIKLPSMTATSLTANHSVGEETALHFLFQKSRVSVLYATDGAWFLKSTWTQLRETELDAVIWDATCGETQGDWRIFEHNSVDMINIMRQTFMKEKILAPRAKILLTHMARTLCAPHNDMTRRLAPQGLFPAYDGLAITICREASFVEKPTASG